jgi:hypothetical protein
MPRKKLTAEERVKQLKIELLELEEEYMKQLYLETMPEYDPSFKYCYASSNMHINSMKQHIDHWLRAVMEHMSKRSTGHGGASTSAVIVSVPIGLNSTEIENWLAYITEKLRQKAKKHGKRS